MKPLPNINDEASMLARGKRSALTSAKNDASEALRDAFVATQSADWPELKEHAEKAKSAAERLIAVADLWERL